MITSYRTKRFRECLKTLPQQVRQKCDELFSVFAVDPYSPALDRCKIESGRLDGCERIHVGREHRAFFRRGALEEDGEEVYVWEWIGAYGDAAAAYKNGFRCSTAYPRRKKVTTDAKKAPPAQATPQPAPKVEPLTFERLPDVLMEAATFMADEAGYRKKLSAELDSARVALTQAQVYAKDVLTGHRTIQAQLDKVREELATAKARAAQLEAAAAVAPSTKPAQAQVDGMVAEIAKLKGELRAAGKFCPHCGKDRVSGLKPGEAA